MKTHNVDGLIRPMYKLAALAELFFEGDKDGGRVFDSCNSATGFSYILEDIAKEINTVYEGEA